MTLPFQNLRSGVVSKRPDATSLAQGQIAINYNEGDPAIYVRGDADALVKISPTYIGSTAPNATPSGSSGNSKGETWLDTSTNPPIIKIWTGSQWNAGYTLSSDSVLASGVTATTAAVGDSSTLVATTAFVNSEIANDAPTKTGGGASGTWGISVSGNAATATALQTSRTISLAGDLSGSATFNGTSNVTITGTIAANSVALGTDTTGNYVATATTSGNGISGSSSTEGGVFTVTSNATNENTASTIVYRDGSGNFSAGTITAELAGNASTSTKLATARAINGVNFDGSAPITVTANTTNTLTRGTYLTGNNFNGGAATTWAVDATSANTASKVVARDGSGNFSAGTITATLNGSATSASSATTATNAANVGLTTSTTASAFKVPFANTTASTNGNYSLLQDSTATFTYNPSTNTLTAGTFSGALSGNASTASALQTARTISLGGDLSGSASFDGGSNVTITGTVGNAATATKLQTARTIGLGGDLSGSASFDGSANVTISATIAANSVALGTDTTGNYVGAGATSGNGISGSVSSEGGTFTVTSNATNANTANTIVYRDASGNFNAGTISAALNGNASTATTLQTARTINGVSFNGSANITVEPYIEDDEGTNATRNVVFTDNSTAGHKRLNEDSSLTYNPSTNTLTATTFNGNATSASQLATARTIGLSGDVSGSASFNGSANITISATVADDSHNHIIGNVDGLQTALDGKGALVDIQEFTTTGTWTKPTGAKMVYVECIGGGGGGGAGGNAQLSFNQPVSGGQGGAGGMRLARWFKASDLGATVTATVGGGGAGGAGLIGGKGNGGSIGGNSSFGSYVIARGGEDGLGGATYDTVGNNAFYLGTSVGDTSDIYYNGGGNGSLIGYPGSPGRYAPYGPGGGGGGAGANSIGSYGGGQGGGGFIAYDNSRWSQDVGGGPSGGAANGGAGTSGTSGTGDGGGGGGGHINGNGGAGGAGAFPGGGGGGGGSTNLDTATVGTGGNGANGVVRVYTYF
ncbi:tail fiber protein [Synechococcus phage S-CBS4]|uniref:tail fiber protein n=1 Tax=Synechococcus phage S-CBS4 TaxID=756275 RepID=UPI000246A708|nr:tail fiber protein [Synechococcus phage S-CBS4]AEX56015.1 tail fiber protein [Synechococcus phage S-CBS4]AGN30506.1 hypothetical protein SXAG_00059 [Synechococcus phage S-CBS4]